MKRKVVVSGARGELRERWEDRGPCRVTVRRLVAGRVGGTKQPPPVEGYQLRTGRLR